MKRTLDIILSLIGIAVVLPFFPFIALLIKLDSKGPVFYKTDRVGKDMRIFKMYKFRTMMDAADCIDQNICPQNDPRVTTFGRFLRRIKLNEFPQLINILKGDMAFVGPRPESPDLAKLYPETAKPVFSVKPGLAGPNQILGRNEEEMYPPGVDAKRYYIDVILPPKIDVDLEYIKRPTVFRDIQYILMAAREVLLGAMNRRHIQDNRSQIYLMVADLLLSAGSLALAYALCIWADPQNAGPVRFAVFPATFLILRFCCFVLFGMYSSLIRYISYHNIFEVLKGVTAGSLLLVIFGFLSGFNGSLRSFVLIDWACLIVLLSGLRFGLRFYWEMKNRGTGSKKAHRVLIFGAGKAGIAASGAMVLDRDNSARVVGFIDDAPEKYGKRLNGYKVLGNRYDIRALAKLYKVNEIILALRDAHPGELNGIINLCQDAGLRYRMFSSGVNPNYGNCLSFPIRPVELSDVLPLERIHMDTDAVKEILAGKTVLLNGAGGALGLKLCSQILQLGCNKLVILDRYDAYLNELVACLLGIFSRDRVVPVLVGSDQGDILEGVFRKHRPEIVFQNGMNKYIPFFDSNSDDIVRTNYRRTFDLARLSQNFGCRHFVMISSFSATTGGHLVANSLRISELSLQTLFEGSTCRLIISRICDIIENRGGIVSIIESQIRKQQTVTLPFPEAEACLISKYSASQFILQTLVETGANNGGKGVYVCEAGSPIRLIEIASKLALLYGLKLGDHLAVRYLNSNGKSKTFNPISEARLLPTLHPRVKFLEESGIFDVPEKRAALGKFLSAETCHFCQADWLEQTRELVNFCWADLFEGGEAKS